MEVNDITGGPTTRAPEGVLDGILICLVIFYHALDVMFEK